MGAKNDDNLPLFLHLEDPIVTYVINNRTLGCMITGGSDRYPFRAYDILHLLFSIPIIQSCFPNRFHNHFTNEEHYFLENNQTCLIGEDFTAGGGVGPYLCLRADVSISKQTPLPVLLHNFDFDGVP